MDCESIQERAVNQLRRAGYGARKRGGAVHGKPAVARPDRVARRASGGAIESETLPDPRQSFGQAFAAARKAALAGGPKTFEWHGKSYNTNLASDAPAASTGRAHISTPQASTGRAHMKAPADADNDEGSHGMPPGGSLTSEGPPKPGFDWNLNHYAAGHGGSQNYPSAPPPPLVHGGGGDDSRPSGPSMVADDGFARGGKVKRRANGGATSDKDSDDDNYNAFLKENARQNALDGKNATPFPKDDGEKRARGGKVRGHGKGPSAVNVIVANGGDKGGADPQREQMAARAGLQQGIALGARAAAAKMAGPGAGPGGPPRPPMGPPPAAAAPGPAGPPMGGPRPPMAKDGGMIRVRAHERRRSGGAV